MEDLSIVIPCYNEALNIPTLINEFEAVVKERKDISIILVDNGSTDNSQVVLQQTIAKSPFKDIFEIVHVPINKGYGHGILQGLFATKTSVIAWTHADLQTPPKDVIAAFDSYKGMKMEQPNKEIFVRGIRKKRAWGATFFTWGMGVMSSMALSQKLYDVNAQPKLFSKSFFDRIQSEAPNDFSLDLYFLYHAQQQCIMKEIPVFFHNRVHGEAKGGGSLKTRIKLIKRTYQYIFELKAKL